MSTSPQTQTYDSVSVVIPFYGDPAPTLALIESLRSEPCTHLAEVIVADDCSPIPFPPTQGVTVVRREVNGGFARAVNSGAARASGDLLLIVNSDLSVSPGFIDDLVRRAQPWMPALVTVPLTEPSGRPGYVGRRFPTTSQYVAEWLVPLAGLRHLRPVHELIGHDTRCDGSRDAVTDWVVGALMLVPLQAYRAVGGMDEGFYMNSEEVDLQRRLRCLGIPSVVLGGAGAEHEGGGSSAPDRRTAWMLDGRRRYERKWRGRAGLVSMEAGMLAATAVNLLWNTARAAAGRDASPMDTARTQYTLIRRPEHWVPEPNRTTAGS